MTPLRVAVCGVAGRMGGALVRALREDPALLLVGATARAGSEPVGRDAGSVAGGAPLGVPVHASLAQVLDAPEARRAQAVLDFTAADASLLHARLCAERGVALVVGTTGLGPAAHAELAGCAQRIPLVHAPNTGVGVNVLLQLVASAARALGPGYEVEIVELHHRQKKDAPSGTALQLAAVAAGAHGLDPSRDLVLQRAGNTGARAAASIGVQALRGGDVVGEHTVLFLGDGERLELIHRATSRDTFARGALRAARFLAGRPPGLYDMQDVLGFTTRTSSP